MKFGLKPHIVEKIQKVFSYYPEIDEVLVYGSRAMKKYLHGSDIDLALVGKKLDLSMLLKIENELDDLFLPHKIDLAIYHKIENPELLNHIDRVGQVFYQNKSCGTVKNRKS